MAAKGKSKSYTEKDISAMECKLQQQQEEIEALRKKLEFMQNILTEPEDYPEQSVDKKKSSAKRKDNPRIFNEAELEQNIKAPEPTEETLFPSSGNQKKKQLTVEESIVELSEEKLICEKCGGTMSLTGTKPTTQSLIITPDVQKLVRFRRCSYTCIQCQLKRHVVRTVSTVTPPALLKNSIVAPATVADIMVRKYAEDISLARQENALKRKGVALPKETMANWIVLSAQTWLKPVYRRLKKHLLSCGVIYADQITPQHAPDETLQTASTADTMWVYASNTRSGCPIRYFEYQPAGSGKGAERFLKDFTGCFVTDGNPAFAKVDNVVRCGCWDQMRNKWKEAMEETADSKISEAAIGQEFCAKLLSMEKHSAKLNNNDRKLKRQIKMEALLHTYWMWVDRLPYAPGSKLEEAVTYAQEQKPFLSAFLEHGEAELSNACAHNAILPFTAERKKTWVVQSTPRGADASTIIYTLVETAKVNGVDPYDYLLQVLSLLPYQGKDPSPEALDGFMPWMPQFQPKDE